MLKRYIQIPLLLGVLGILSSCNSTTVIQVQSDSVRNDEIRSKSTYAWVPNAVTKQGLERIERIKELDGLVKRSVEEVMNSKGYRKVGYSEADIRLASHAALFDAAFETRVGDGQSFVEYSHSMMVEYEKGALVVEALEPGSGATLWSGSVSAVFDMNNLKKLRQKKAAGVIGKLMEAFPAKK